MREELYKMGEMKRGLWIGLFPTLLPRTDIDDITWWMPDDAHITLVHLGKGHSKDQIDKVVESTIEVNKRFLQDSDSGFRLELTGCGWFFRKNPTMIALMNGPVLPSLRNDLINVLQSRNVYVSDRYGFIPHITLDKEKIDNTGTQFSLHHATAFRNSKSQMIKFGGLSIVCGDVRFPCYSMNSFSTEEGLSDCPEDGCNGGWRKVDRNGYVKVHHKNTTDLQPCPRSYTTIFTIFDK